jgi:uridine kinase
MPKPMIIGVTGGSGSGKSLFLSELLRGFDDKEICLITQDNYYMARELQPIDTNGVKNFDRPESIDHEQLFKDINSIVEGKEVEIVEYTFNNPSATPKKLIFRPAPVIIVEGLMVFYWENIRSLIDLSVFVEASDLIKVKRRIIRDAKERGYDLDDVLYRYEHHVAPFYDQFLKPLKDEVDIIIPNNSNFDKGLMILSGYIRNYMNTI